MASTEFKHPSDCSDGELIEFEHLVIKGKQVDPNGLSGRIRRAERLIFTREGERLVGVAGVKRPTDNYRKETAEKAKVILPQDEWPYELGWVFVEEDMRGKGLSHGLVTHATAALDAKIFATVRANNAGMIRPLSAVGFLQTGEKYWSGRQQSWMQLLVRE